LSIWKVIGFRKTARGQGIATATASYAFLELARTGVTHVAYPLVLDDNWASRRIGERLGGIVRANWMTYRRNFKH
jgi:L-amino acid N-acyltransferase YncA